jgi:hypothetical protein
MDGSPSKERSIPFTFSLTIACPRFAGNSNRPNPFHVAKSDYAPDTFWHARRLLMSISPPLKNKEVATWNRGLVAICRGVYNQFVKSQRLIQLPFLNLLPIVVTE